jgi:hypothetical protein
MFIHYIFKTYFNHHVKLSLFIGTPNSFFLFFPQDLHHLHVSAWKLKPQGSHSNSEKPLHIKKTVSGLVTKETATQIVVELPIFQMTALLCTPLQEVAVLTHVTLVLSSLDVTQLTFDPSVPAFTIPWEHCIPVHILAAPFVMMLNGSTTPDPRLHQSGTYSLWKTLVPHPHASTVTAKQLRYGCFLQQLKTMEWSKTVDAASNDEGKDHYDQFAFEF